MNEDGLVGRAETGEEVAVEDVVDAVFKRSKKKGGGQRAARVRASGKKGRTGSSRTASAESNTAEVESASSRLQSSLYISLSDSYTALTLNTNTNALLLTFLCSTQLLAEFNTLHVAIQLQTYTKPSTLLCGNVDR